MTEAEYRAHPNLNASAACHLIPPSTPAHFQAALAEDREETVDQRMGTMIHAYLLQGVEPQYVLRPETTSDGSPWHGGKKECKAWKAEQEAAGRIILNGKEELRQVRMIQSLKNHRMFQFMLGLCKEREAALLGIYRDTPIKGLLDAWGYDSNGVPFILDLKKTRCSHPESFGKTCIDFDYYFKASWYQALLADHLGIDEAPAFYWVAVEDSAAAPVTVIQQTPTEAAIGESQMRAAVDLFAECSRTNKWPSYSDGILPAITPEWAVRKYL
jgi:hypothetical protein